jgi:transposase
MIRSQLESTPGPALGDYHRAKILRVRAELGKDRRRCLEQLGHEVVVADPNFAAMYATRSRKVKTDRRDARTLAEACRLGAYRPAHRTSDRQRQVRAQLRAHMAGDPAAAGIAQRLLARLSAAAA